MVQGFINQPLTFEPTASFNVERRHALFANPLDQLTMQQFLEKVVVTKPLLLIVQPDQEQFSL